jgi:phosphate transport system substrate-binding protein
MTPSHPYTFRELRDDTSRAAEYAQDMPEDFRVSITDAPGKLAYPISSFTWLLVPEKINDKNKLTALRDFLKWALTDGQKLTNELMYAPLPLAVVAREEKILSALQ